jgi:threonine/homoserine/homoserine lactone efflux protein
MGCHQGPGGIQGNCFQYHRYYFAPCKLLANLKNQGISEYLAYGIAVGLAAGVSPGPLLTLVITETLRGNRTNGILIALAPLLTDLPIVLASILLLEALPEQSFILGSLSIAGGAFLLYLGIDNIKYRPSAVNSKTRYQSSLKNGIITNFLSPHPYIFWLTIGAPTFIKSSQSSIVYGIIFIAAFYFLLIGSKMVIAVLIGYLNKSLSGNVYTLLIKLLGALLIVLAFLMIHDGLTFISPHFTLGLFDL